MVQLGVNFPLEQHLLIGTHESNSDVESFEDWPFVDMKQKVKSFEEHKYNVVAACPSGTAPTVTAFAIQPSCTDGVAGSDGYLQLSSVTDGDAYHWSTGNTFDDNGGANTFANATSLSLIHI